MRLPQNQATSSNQLAVYETNYLYFHFYLLGLSLLWRNYICQYRFFTTQNITLRNDAATGKGISPSRQYLLLRGRYDLVQRIRHTQRQRNTDRHEQNPLRGTAHTGWIPRRKAATRNAEWNS